MAGRAGGRAETFDAPRRRESAWPVRVPRSLRDAADAARKWAQAEVAPGQLMPWLPIAFGTGIYGRGLLGRSAFVVRYKALREPANPRLQTPFIWKQGPPNSHAIFRARNSPIPSGTIFAL